MKKLLLLALLAADPAEPHFDEGFDEAAKKAITDVYKAAKDGKAAALKAKQAPGARFVEWSLHPEKMKAVVEAISRGCTTDDSQDETVAKSNPNSIHCPSWADEESADIPGVTVHFVKTKGKWLLAGMEPRAGGANPNAKKREPVKPPPQEGDEPPPKAETVNANATASSASEVPPEVTDQLAKLKTALEKKDFDAMRAVLPSTFTVDEMTREDALDFWKAHPKKIEQVLEALKKGCGVAANTKGRDITCPKLTGHETKGSVHFLAVNKDERGKWKIASFDTNEED